MKLYAGFGKSEITPPLGVELAGYGYYLERRCVSVRDPLYARAVAIQGEEAGQTQAQILLSCDVLGLSADVTRSVWAHAREKGIPPERVLLVSTHTHTGPCVKYHEGTGETDENYLSALPQRLCAALDAALEDLTPVSRMTFSMRTLSRPYFMNRADPSGPVDPAARILTVHRENKSPVALVNAACHGVFQGRKDFVSADYAGKICAALEKEGACAVYLNGLCGDIDPERPGEAAMNALAEETAALFREEGKQLPLTLQGGRLDFSVRLTPVTRAQINEAADHAARNAQTGLRGADRVARKWREEMLENFDRLETEEPCGAAWCLLGGVPFMALPFEGYTQMGVLLRNALSAPEAFLLGCAEEIKGYLPARDDFENGSYAALESTFLYKRLPYVPGEMERVSFLCADGLCPFLEKQT